MKQVSAQINVDYGIERVMALDRIAAKLSMSRADFMRKKADEVIAADQDDREPFQHGTPEFGADEIGHLLREIRALITELDRLTRDNARLKADLKKVLDAYEQDAAAARERGAAQIAARLDGAVHPFLRLLNETKAELRQMLDEQPRLDAIDAHLVANTEAMTTNATASERRSRKPRAIFSLVLGDDKVWSTMFLSLWSLVMMSLGAQVMMTMGSVIPRLSVPVASGMLNGDHGICRLLEYRYGQPDCQVPPEHQIDRTFHAKGGDPEPAKADGR